MESNRKESLSPSVVNPGLECREGDSFSMKTQPLPHQLDVWRQTKDRRYFALFLEQGLGKTKIALDTAGWLLKQGRINRMLVIAPNGVHLNWVRNEMPKHCPVPYDSMAWRSNLGTKALTYIEDMINEKSWDRLQILCMNVEATRTRRGYETAFRFASSGYCLTVVDESTTIKTMRAQQTRAVLTLGRVSDYRRILTGTPVAHNPIDLYSQCKFLDKRALPYSTLSEFKANFAIEDRMTLGTRSFLRVIGFKNLNRLSEMLSDFSVRLTKDECLDLPEKIYLTRYVGLTDEQRSVYQSIKEQALTELEGGSVTVASALTVLNKLMQVTTGFVYDDEKQGHEIKNHRVEVLLDLIEETEGKVVIWIPFRFNTKQIIKALEKEHGTGSTVTYTGGDSTTDRADAVDAFQHDPTVRFLIATSAGAKGITLTAATTAVYYGNGTRLENRIQSEDRIHRIGQNKSVNIIDLITPDTVDEHVMQILRNKGEIANILLKNIGNLRDIL